MKSEDLLAIARVQAAKALRQFCGVREGGFEIESYSERDERIVYILRPTERFGYLVKVIIDKKKRTVELPSAVPSKAEAFDRRESKRSDEDRKGYRYVRSMAERMTEHEMKNLMELKKGIKLTHISTECYQVQGICQMVLPEGEGKDDAEVH